MTWRMLPQHTCDRSSSHVTSRTQYDLFSMCQCPHYFSSKTMHCQNCHTRQLTNGQTLYYHAAITPVIVCPGQAQVIALPPEYIMPQDGHAKQDCERAAGTRWMRKHAEQVASHGVTLLGDDLYSNQPFCTLVLHHRFNFILTCKPDSHATLYERLAFWQANDGITERAGRHWNGRFTEVTMVRHIERRNQQGFLQAGAEPALKTDGKKVAP